MDVDPLVVISAGNKDRRDTITALASSAFLEVGDVKVTFQDGAVVVEQGHKTYRRDLELSQSANPNYSKVTFKLGAGAPPTKDG